jgi:ubiquinone biosynthesis protein COQ9
VLKGAIALVPTHGFTRHALASAATSLPEPHSSSLSESSINALFGAGDDARRTLVKAWFEDAEKSMIAPGKSGASAVKTALGERLKANEPVLHLLPEVCTCLSTRSPLLIRGS